MYMMGTYLWLGSHWFYPLWRQQMEAFSASLGFCVVNSPVTGEFPTQRPVTQSFDVFFDLHLNRQLSKQWKRWWFETLPRPLWRHCNAHFKKYFTGSWAIMQKTNFTNPRKRPVHIQQCSIQYRNLHISVLMEHCGTGNRCILGFVNYVNCSSACETTLQNNGG